MSKVLYSPKVETYTAPTSYCPGCGHGQLHKIIGDAIDELKIREKIIFVDSVGCSVFAYKYFDCDHIQVPHGRAPAAATGIKRLMPENVVLTYQGDGDLAAIGTAEIIHAANRGENISVFFVNNAIYGMTGGQMAPTTLIGQKTTTSHTGRDEQVVGYPIKVCELLNTLEAPIYLERVAMFDALHIRQTKEAIKKSFRIQLKNKGFSLVEILSNCPTNWKMTPEQSMDYVKNEMTQEFKLGTIRDKEFCQK
ncbi:2-oxoglutarate oxidoreductase [Candidatus Woesearchaeota archaeon]|nr:2-oxoglutarate oxidoreductase [Candidatus Woesearchaeota archaeon]